jgi:hypothetical protein
MRDAVKIGFVIALTVILFMGCDKDKSYPETPVLEFLRMDNLGPDSIALVVGFQDGDGDIGSRVESPGENEPQCPTLDLLSRYYEMVDGEWVQLPAFNSGWCVQSLTPIGQDKTLEGEIITRLEREINIEEPAPNSDSSRVGLRLRDRAGHISNEVFSPLILN